MASPYTRMVASLFFPAHEWAKGHSTVSMRKALEASQWLDAVDLERLRVERLRNFLGEIARHVPYYRRLIAECGLVPDQITNIADLRRIPFLTKPLIRAHLQELKAEDAVGLRRYNTGGSSGEPLVFYIGKDRVSHDVAAKWRATRWWDVDIGDREIVVWGSPIELGAQDRVRQLRDEILRTRLLPAFDFSKENLDKFVSEIRALRPRMIFGYPSSLALIAQHAEQNRIRMDDLGIRVAFVTSEMLYDHQRSQIGRIFGCRVANGYGGRDAGFIAHECPEGGMHIAAEDIIVETVGESGSALPPGEAGEIVVTHLATRDFPLVRYRTGDMGILDDRRCACGRGLPLLKEIQGRNTDFIIAADGTVMHGLALIYVLRDLPGIARFKIVQESATSTRVLVVPEDSFGETQINAIIRGLKARLGENVKICIQQVAEIPPEPSGKFRYVVSRVART
jgi:phenylacetate-coenzyme A ligase PaaK-like adenylate-forming protein